MPTKPPSRPPCRTVPRNGEFFDISSSCNHSFLGNDLDLLSFDNLASLEPFFLLYNIIIIITIVFLVKSRVHVHLVLDI